MLYTSMIKVAMRIAFDAHKEQVDKTGMPYIFHPFHLAEQMDNEIAICAALLHDVVEDTPISFEDLRQTSIADEVLIVLKLLTHADNMAYIDYVKCIKDSGNQNAIAIKLADLRHNSDPARLDSMDDRMLARFEKYKMASDLLER